MENKVDSSKFDVIEDVALRPTKYLRNFYRYYSSGNQYREECSCFYLRSIVLAKAEDILDTIPIVYKSISKEYYSKTGTIDNRRIPAVLFVWARLCAVAYYFYHEDKLWLDFVWNKLLEYIQVQELKDDLQLAITKIDERYEEKKNFAEVFQKKQVENTPKSSVIENKKSEPKDEMDDLPCLIKTMQDIQDGKICNLNKVNWVEGIQEMVRLGKLMPAKFPPVCWLWVVSGIIEEPTKRMDVLGKMQDVASQCFNSKKEESEFVRDCDSLVKINGRIREYYLRNDTDKSAIWKGEKKIHDGLAHLLADKYVSPKEMVAIAEQSYCSVQNKEKPQILTLILRADQYVNRMSMDNILDFSKNLYLAEGFRQLFLSGKDDYFDFPTISSFNRKIRNACFDVYIDLRIQQIREELDKDNTRVDDPDDLECLETLLEDEKMIADRENLFEGFRGSSAYEAMWYPGREMVLELINVFVEYLQKKVNQKRNVIEAPRGSIYYNVHGDIVQGDKRIGTVVRNVEKGGIGVQTNEK